MLRRLKIQGDPRRNLVFVLVVLALIAGRQAQGLSPTAPDFTMLSVRALGMGGAFTGLADDEQAVFYNPAGLAFQDSPRFGTSHSARHFPGETKNLDQLDADPTALVFPLGIPGGTMGYGFTILDEQGYDYLERNDEEYPQERLWGRSERNVYARSLGPFAFGLGRTSSHHRFSAPEAGEEWARWGEGPVLSTLARLFPWYSWGMSWQKEAFTRFNAGTLDESASDRKLSSLTTTRTGECTLIPGGMRYLRDVETRRFKFREAEGGKNIVKERRVFKGVEIPLGGNGAVRFGSYDGHATWGFTLDMAIWRFHWAKVDNLLPEIVGEGYPDKFTDFICYGSSWGL